MWFESNHFEPTETERIETHKAMINVRFNIFILSTPFTNLKQSFNIDL